MDGSRSFAEWTFWWEVILQILKFWSSLMILWVYIQPDTPGYFAERMFIVLVLFCGNLECNRYHGIALMPCRWGSISFFITWSDSSYLQCGMPIGSKQQNWNCLDMLILPILSFMFQYTCYSSESLHYLFVFYILQVDFTSPVPLFGGNSIFHSFPFCVCA